MEGVAMAKNKKNDQLFVDYFRYWYETYRFPRNSEITKLKYESFLKINLMQSNLAKLTISEISRKEAQEFMNWYGGSHSKNTVYDNFNFLKSCMKCAISEGIVKTNPFDLVTVVFKEQNYDQKKLKSIREKKKTLEFDEYIRLKKFIVSFLKNWLELEPSATTEGVRRKGVSVQSKAMCIFIALKTGARFSEILGITKEDVNLQEKTLNIDKTWGYKTASMIGFQKTKNIASIRKIAVDDEFIEIFKKYIVWLKKYQVSINQGAILIENHKLYFNSTINDFLSKTLRTCGIEDDLTIHKLRHTQASILLSQGVDIQVVAKRLGHTDTNMVATTYGHLLNKTEANETQKILSIL